MIEQLLARAKQHEGVLTKEEISAVMPSLSDEQWQALAAFLAEHEIRVREIYDPKESRSQSSLMKELSIYAKDAPLLSMYLQELKKLPKRTEEEEEALFAALAAGDPKAKDPFIHSQLPMVCETALLYASQGSTLEDLIQEGNVGLMLGLSRALAEAESWRKVLLSEVMEAMEQHIYEENANETVGRKSVERAETLRDNVKQYKTEFGFAPDKHELADYMDLDPEELEQIYKLAADEGAFSKEDEDE
ncbi:MAG: hypothetical protein IJ744_10470 [Lachnospiraceae bacterium]|nr:hypothetical protein [Lachnospiraceae bacterium]